MSPSDSLSGSGLFIGHSDTYLSSEPGSVGQTLDPTLALHSSLVEVSAKTEVQSISEILDLLTRQKTLSECVSIFRTTLKEFEGITEFHTKEDDSLCSSCEIAIEENIGTYLRKATPWASFIGEEGLAHEAIQKGSELTWYLDPIDGTISFYNHLDTFAFTLTLVMGKEPIATVIDIPKQNKTYIAEKGRGATCNGKALNIQNVRKTSHSLIAVSDHYAFGLTKREPVLEALLRSPFIARTYTDIHGYTLVAEGKCVAVFDAAGALWDLYPAKLLIEESGGECRFYPIQEKNEDLMGSMLSGKESILDEIQAFLKGLIPQSTSTIEW